MLQGTEQRLLRPEGSHRTTCSLQLPALSKLFALSLSFPAFFCCEKAEENSLLIMIKAV